MDKLGFQLNIRGKLMLGFLSMIALTLIVSIIAFVSQRFAKTTIDELVQVQGKIARLSLQTDKIIKIMSGHEKDFFINYKTVGIQEAKNIYLNAALTQGGEAYNTLYEIQQLAETDDQRTAAQSAMDAINEYLGTFLGTVNILELRIDPEFGELTKLEQAGQEVKDAVLNINYGSLNDRFYNLQLKVQQYIALPKAETIAEVLTEFNALQEGITADPLSVVKKKDLLVKMGEYSKWFTEVAKNDQIIAMKTEEYQAAAKRAEPVIESFLNNAEQNETAAITGLQKTQNIIGIIIVVVGFLAIILGVVIAIGLSRGLTKQVDHIMTLLGDIGMGNFDSRTEVVSSDELGTMASTLNAMLDNITILIQSQEERDHIQDSIMKLLEEISDLTDGDLTARAEVTEDVTGAIADSFNTMADQFGGIIRQVKETTASVDDTSADVTKRTKELAQKSVSQTEQVGGAVGSIGKIVASIHDVSNSASQSAEVSNLSRTHAREGAEAVNKTNVAMDEIREQINETARSIKRLGESSMEIGNVVQIINDIADKTSILALNASIQAAMAGEAGHGFAVVAEEVQRLSESSSNSTKQIESLVKSIQSEIKDVGNRMDESISKVVQGSQLADDAHEKLQQIESVSNQLADLIESITSATTEQVKVSDEIAHTMHEVGEVSKETSLASQETAESMTTLSDTAHTLRKAVEMFKIEDSVQAS